MKASTLDQAAIKWRRRRLLTQWVGIPLVYILLLVAGIVFIAPFLWMVVTSLKLSEQVFAWPPILIPHPIRWANYYDALTFLPFGLYFRNSTTVCTLVVLGTVMSNTLVAYGFARVDWIGRDAVFVLVLATMMLPMQVTMIPMFIIFRKLGWIGTFAPLTVPAFLGSAYYAFLMRQFFRSIPFELSDAARIDGASEFGIFARIIMPMSKPVVTTVGLFAFIYTWNDFMGPLVYLHDERLYTVQLGLQQFQSRYVTPMNQLMAASAVAIVPVVVVFLLAQRTFVEGISITGLGGR
ncbi:MAG: carbohydrate ABC transporter permease [Anaerolineae bacterium]|nr:carbohydrate ABC transporter permease [Anaerolineae bacterium]